VPNEGARTARCSDRARLRAATAAAIFATWLDLVFADLVFAA
jgi:hypothetical protein